MRRSVNREISAVQILPNSSSTLVKSKSLTTTQNKPKENGSVGRNSVVGIATRHVLNVPPEESR
jgi:hypothetical protein